MFVLYDGRAIAGDEDEATVMDTAHTESEARKQGRREWAGHDAIWYEYDEEPGGTLVNGRPRFDLPPQRKAKQ